MDTVRINPEFDRLREEVSRIPQEFGATGTVLYRDRNVVLRTRMDGRDVVIKNYRKHTLFNRFAYRWLRPSKARRAYEYAFLLLERNIRTPKPIAYIESSNPLILKDSYCITEYCDYPFRLQSITERPFDDIKEILQAFARFIFSLHQQNIFHADLSLGNILFTRSPSGYAFSMVDINRIYFRRMTLYNRLSNFARIDLPENHMAILAKAYARLANIGADATLRGIMRHKKRSGIFRNIKDSVKVFACKLLGIRLNKNAQDIVFHHRDTDPASG